MLDGTAASLYVRRRCNNDGFLREIIIWYNFQQIKIIMPVTHHI